MKVLPRDETVVPRGRFPRFNVSARGRDMISHAILLQLHGCWEYFFFDSLDRTISTLLTEEVGLAVYGAPRTHDLLNEPQLGDGT